MFAAHSVCAVFLIFCSYSGFRRFQNNSFSVLLDRALSDPVETCHRNGLRNDLKNSQKKVAVPHCLKIEQNVYESLRYCEFLTANLTLFGQA